MSKPSSRSAALRLGAAVLCFAATLAVAIPVVNARLNKRSGDQPPTLIIAPSAGDGITVTPGAGRVLFVDSSPDGAKVKVKGQVVGTTPWSSDWSCDEGEQVQVVVERQGYLPRTNVVACQAGTTRIAVTLERPRR
ncbi:MAG: PEGA domain-containing protein [Myxococcaceae bacterium]